MSKPHSVTGWYTATSVRFGGVPRLLHRTHIATKRISALGSWPVSSSPFGSCKTIKRPARFFRTAIWIEPQFARAAQAAPLPYNGKANKRVRPYRKPVESKSAARGLDTDEVGLHGKALRNR